MKKVVYLLLACAVVAGCRSSKKAAKDDGLTAPESDITTIQAPNGQLETTENGKKDKKEDKKKDSYKPKNTIFTAKVKAKVTAGGESISTSGSLKMRWDDVIQLSLVDPIFGITEVGRLEFSADNVLVIDRINKQYCQETYEKITSLTKQPISFETVQTLVWQQAEVGVSDNVTFTIPAKKKITVDLRLTNKGNSSNWEAHTTVSTKYKKVDAETLFKALMQ